jgi:hypothetical protein
VNTPGAPYQLNRPSMLFHDDVSLSRILPTLKVRTTRSRGLPSATARTHGSKRSSIASRATSGVNYKSGDFCRVTVVHNSDVRRDSQECDGIDFRSIGA